VAGQIPEALFGLLCAQPLLAMAGEDRFDRGFLVDFVDDDDDDDDDDACPAPLPRR
jgi:hypothetical protein